MKGSGKSCHGRGLIVYIYMVKNRIVGKDNVLAPFSEISETGYNCREILQFKIEFTEIAAKDNRAEALEYRRIPKKCQKKEV